MPEAGEGGLVGEFSVCCWVDGYACGVVVWGGFVSVDFGRDACSYLCGTGVFGWVCGLADLCEASVAAEIDILLPFDILGFLQRDYQWLTGKYRSLTYSNTLVGYKHIPTQHNPLDFVGRSER